MKIKVCFFANPVALNPEKFEVLNTSEHVDFIISSEIDKLHLKLPKQFGRLILHASKNVDPNILKENTLLTKHYVATESSKLSFPAIYQNNVTLIDNEFNWSDYLETLYHSNKKTRVLVYIPDIQDGEEWLAQLMNNSNEIDWVGVVYTNSAKTNIELLHKLVKHSPIIALQDATKEHLDSLVERCRPAVVLSYGIKKIDTLLPEMPIVILDQYQTGGISNNLKIDQVFTNPLVSIGPRIEGFQFEKRDRKTCRDKLGFKNDEILIANIGQFEKIKNPHLLAGAIELLPKNYRAVYLGWNLGKSAVLNSITRRATIYPYENQDQLIDFLNAIDAIVLTSKQTTNDSILAAWAAELPLICSKVGLISEFSFMFQKDLAIVLPNDPSEFTIAEAIKKALEDQSYKQTIKIAKTVQNEFFSRSKMVANWEKYLRDRKPLEIDSDNLESLVQYAPDLTRVKQTKLSKLNVPVVEPPKTCRTCQPNFNVPQFNKTEAIAEKLREIKRKLL